MPKLITKTYLPGNTDRENPDYEKTFEAENREDLGHTVFFSHGMYGLKSGAYQDFENWCYRHEESAIGAKFVVIDPEIGRTWGVEFQEPGCVNGLSDIPFDEFLYSVEFPERSGARPPVCIGEENYLSGIVTDDEIEVIRELLELYDQGAPIEKCDFTNLKTCGPVTVARYKRRMSNPDNVWPYNNIYLYKRG